MRQHRIYTLDLWRFLDRDGDDRLSASELFNGLRALGLHNMIPAHVYELVQSLDRNRDGWIQKDEFMAALNDPSLEAEIREYGDGWCTVVGRGGVGSVGGE